MCKNIKKIVNEDGCPNADRIMKNGVLLPLHHGMKDEFFKIYNVVEFLRNIKMIRNLVTGGAGFLGSHFIDKLISQGEEVICIDNFHTGRKNISHLLNNPKFELIRHDITEPISL